MPIRSNDATRQPNRNLIVPDRSKRMKPVGTY